MTSNATTAVRTDSQEIVITDPRDDSLVGRMRVADSDELIAALASARAGFRSWSKTSAAERGAALRRAAAAVEEHATELAELNTRETGRPFDQALAGVLAGADTLYQYAEFGPLHRGHSLGGQVTAADYTVREPRGVVLAVTPWNDPIAVAAGLLGAGIVTGNAVVHKPSERCPQVGSLLNEIVGAVLPDGVLVGVTGDAATGRELVAHDGIDVIAHVGSTATGQSISRAAALTGAHVVRENGGNDALVVDGDVDPVWAAEQAAIGAFSNSGQICTSVERIFVHAGIAAAFTDALVAEARQRNDTHELGPLVDDALRELVHAQVAASLRAGAVARIGAEIPAGPGSYYPATVLTECTTTMPVMTEETFGPVAPIQVVDSFDAALACAVQDRYGLAATVLTSSMEHAHRAVHELPVGTVKVNAVFGGAPGGSAQPRGASGMGYGYGPELLDELTTTKVVHLGPPPVARTHPEHEEWSRQ